MTESIEPPVARPLLAEPMGGGGKTGGGEAWSLMNTYQLMLPGCLAVAAFMLCGCSALFISKGYRPSPETKWTMTTADPYDYSKKVDGSQFSIRSIHTKDVALMGPVFVPFIPMVITKHGGQLYFELNIRTNDTVNPITPPVIRLYDPVSQTRLDPIEVAPLDFELVKRLKLYHLDFNWSTEYRITQSYFYLFQPPKKGQAIYFEFGALTPTDTTRDMLKYEPHKSTHYKPIIIPQPS